MRRCFGGGGHDLRRPDIGSRQFGTDSQRCTQVVIASGDFDPYWHQWLTALQLFGLAHSRADRAECSILPGACIGCVHAEHDRDIVARGACV
jgi:hypothetical protein